MKTNKATDWSIFLVIGIALLYSLIELIRQIQSGYFPRTTTIILFLFSGIVFSLFILDKRKK